MLCTESTVMFSITSEQGE